MSKGIMRSAWPRWTLAIVVIVSMLGLSVGIWYWSGKPEVDEEAEQRAQELFDLARGAGMLQQVEDEAAFVNDMAQIYGNDGGYGVELARGTLAEAALTYDLARTGEVTSRPIIAEPRFIEFQLLVMKVYSPDVYRDKILPFIRDMKLEGELPAWLQEDLNSQ